MVANFFPNPNYTVAEKFVVEKLLEQLFNKTLDSHRTKLNNPKWLLKELFQVLSDLHSGKIKAYDKTVIPIILECKRFLMSENELEFKRINRKYFITLIDEANCKQPEKHQSEILRSVVNLILEDNEQYCLQLFDAVKAEINVLNSKGQELKVFDLEKLSRLTAFLATELCNIGYAKGYLSKLIRRQFNERQSNSDFFNSYKCLCDLAQRTKEKFLVIFKIEAKNKRKAAEIKSPFLLSTTEIEEFRKINQKSENFLKEHNDYSVFIGIPMEHLDYLTVIKTAKIKLLEIIDLLHLGFPNETYEFDDMCLVIGSKRKDLVNTQRVNYETDGNYKNSQILYDTLHQKVNFLLGAKHIKEESILKIISALRHLRLGREANELEQKFIHYWIGLEYVFSDYDARENSIHRLKEHFINSHALAYLKRNLKDFHNDLKRAKDRLTQKTISEDLVNYSDDLEYLKLSDTYDSIVDNQLNTHPLLSYRAYKIKQRICNRSKLKDLIERHRKNLDWHLTRCYRIRNEIVHDAALHLNIELITGNLKYYLTFVLNALLEYFNNTPKDFNVDGEISINDFFILNTIKYNNALQSENIFEAFMSEKSVTDIFT